MVGCRWYGLVHGTGTAGPQVDCNDGKIQPLIAGHATKSLQLIGIGEEPEQSHSNMPGWVMP